MKDYCEYTKKVIEKFSLNNNITFEEYLLFERDALDNVPDNSGVILVIYPYKEINFKKDFDRHYNIYDNELKEKWVEDADILYIGGAYETGNGDKPKNIDLKTKIQRLFFKDYKHSFMRKDEEFIWFNKNSSHFKIYWYAIKEDENSYDLEKELIINFIKEYGKPPLGNLSLPINNELNLYNEKDYIDYVCPQPPKWAKIYESLTNTYEKNTGEEIGKRSLSAYKDQGLPIPLILGGWWDSGDGQKSERWQGTIKWAADHDLLYLIDVKEDEKFRGHS